MAINNLREVYEKKGEDFLLQLLNNYVIINEKVDGTFFGVKKSKNDTFRYFKKSGEITYVDRVLMKYYNSAISHFEQMPLEKRQRIPSNFYFGFEYFTRGDSMNHKYSTLPKNGLVLSYIHRLNDSGEVVATVQHKEQLDRWADYLNVERPPIVFEGYLTDDQKKEILDFVYATADQLLKKFKTTSFSKYILSVLMQETKANFLDHEIGENIETLIFRFYDEQNDGEEKVFLAKIVDPLFQNRESANELTKENRSQDYIWLIVIDLMNHFELYDLTDLRKMASGSNFDERYVSLINSIFKDFIAEYSSKYEGLNLEIPEYLKRPEFALDLSLIRDKDIEKMVKSDDTYAEIYKILLNFFRRTRKKTTASFFTPELLSQLNIIVTKIRNIIMGDEVYESLFPSFSEFIGSTNEDRVLSEKEATVQQQNKKELTPVNLLVGSFQPIHLGHIKALEKLKEKNDLPTILIAIKPNSQTTLSPFSNSTTKRMLEKARREHGDLIIDFKIVTSNQLEEIIEAISEKYKPMLCGISEKRSKDYLLQLDYIKKKNIPLRLANEFKIVQLPIFVKSNDVINAIKSSDFSQYKKLVPNSIESEFYNLQKELDFKKNESESISENIELNPMLENWSPAKIVNPKLKEDV